MDLMVKYSRGECRAALRRATKQLGESPTRREYESLGIVPSATTIESRFGGWNAAKRAAGLQVRKGGRSPGTVDANFFDRIEEPDSAYWLGFLFGDGHVRTRDAERGRYDVRLAISVDDLGHLERYRHAIGSEHRIVEDGSMRSLTVGDPEFVDTLLDKGLTPTKGTDGALPDLTRWSLRRAFVRGLADADGYYGHSKWTITDATDRRLRRLQQWIPVESELVYEEVDDRSWVYLRVTSKERLRVLYSWLFPKGPATEPSMQRKRDSALDYLQDNPIY